jgi:hypothetical protein
MIEKTARFPPFGFGCTFFARAWRAVFFTGLNFKSKEA